MKDDISVSSASYGSFKNEEQKMMAQFDDEEEEENKAPLIPKPIKTQKLTSSFIEVAKREEQMMEKMDQDVKLFNTDLYSQKAEREKLHLKKKSTMIQKSFLKKAGMKVDNKNKMPQFIDDVYDSRLLTQENYTLATLKKNSILDYEKLLHLGTNINF